MNAAFRIGVPFLATFAFACGVDNAVVGGRCRDGFFAEAGRCVPVAGPNGPASSEQPESAENAENTIITTSVVDLGTAPTAVEELPWRRPTPEIQGPPQPLVCDAPLVACHDACIPVTDDPANCGACGKICPSNICVAGECQGATPGDIVIVGHDFASSWAGSSQAKVLRNAVAIPTTDPVRILSFDGEAAADSIARVKGLATIPGRSVTFVTGNAASVESMTLAQSYDIVLLQDGAPANDPRGTGDRFKASLEKFTKKGGVVVAIAGGATNMPELLGGAGLAEITGQTSFPASTHLSVDAPADVIGVQVISPYAASGSSIGFSGLVPAADTTWVVRQKTADDSGLPIVIHRVVR